MNTTTNYTDTENFRYIGISIGTLDILLGTSGNILTIYAVLKNKLLRQQPFNMFIVNLCVIDFLTSMFMMPLNVTGYVLMSWPLGMKACIFQAFFYFSCGYTSVVCLIAITINRLVGIVWPNSYRVASSSLLKILLVLCWLLAPAFLLPFLIVSLHELSKYHEDNLLTGWNEKQYLCTFVHVQGSWKIYMQVLRIFFQFLPMVVMIVSYTMMFYCLRKTHTKIDYDSKQRGYSHYKRKMQSWKAYDNRTGDEYIGVYPQNEESLSLKSPKSVSRTASTVSKISACSKIEYEINGNKIVVRRTPLLRRYSSHQLRHDQEVHLMHVSVIVCVTFTCLFLPSCIVNLLPGRANFDPRVHMAASNVTWLNSCVNPLIYAFLHDPMRKEYKRMLKHTYMYLRNNFCWSRATS